MVRNSLVENRIRFDSDKGPSGGGPDRSNPAEMAQREKDFRESLGYTGDEGRNRFAEDVSAGAFGSADDASSLVGSESQAAQQQASQRAQDRADQRRDIFDLVSSTAQQSLDARPSTSTRTTGLDRSFFGDAYKDLYGQDARGTTLNAVMQGGPLSRLASALFDTPTPREQAAMTAGQMFSLARRNMTPEEEAGLISGTNAMFDADTGTFSDVPIGGTGGTMSTGFLGAPVYSGRPDPNYVNEDNPAFQRQVRGNFGDEQDRGDGGQAINIFGDSTGVGNGMADGSAAAAGAIPSSELALNYLQNPYYAYSGFGNQYNPYGFANNTLVDLLQTRNLTQPAQADTLGLFGNPTDFS